MRVVIALLVLLTAGCLQPAPASDAATTTSDFVPIACPSGQVQTGLDATGTLLCSEPEPPARVDLSFQNGYSSRRSADAATLDRVMLVVALAPGSADLSLDEVRVWHVNGTAAHEYGGQAANDLAFRWLRGTGPSVMVAGDIVELTYEPMPHLPPRTVFNVTILGASDAVEATLETVSSFGDDTTYVLLAHEAPPAEQTAHTASGLKFQGVYGERASTESDISRLRVMIELASGSDPIDLSKLVTRHRDGANVTAYAAAETTRTWIHGTGTDGVMLPGDIVEVAYDLARPLPTRTQVQVTLVPEAGAPMSADLKTPPTYGADLVITLR